MRIEEFNTLPARDAAALLRSCADADSWVESLVAKRPYPDVEALVATADDLAGQWSVDEVEQALSHHPRIGERTTDGSAASSTSAREQAGVDPADIDLADALRAGNLAYEEKFGRIYLVRAKGRTGPQLLKMLRERLENDPETEFGITVQQLREIAILRAEGLFS
jgi:2-oxo-4-hydroxy-4-carboxy-5-ureidoimidazoline decarboxylase